MRTTVKALHRGKVVAWPVEEITHFDHADKYVTAHHEDGRELLIDDTLKSLAIEFESIFIRASRSLIVSRRRIVSAEHYPERIEGYIKVACVSIPLKCSRSCMPIVRAFLRKRTDK